MSENTRIAMAPRAARPGALRHVLETAQCSIRDRDAATLVIVLETEGSTYAKAGAMAWFGPEAQTLGWLSGGCLEPEIQRRADQVSAALAFDVMSIDTRDDEDLFAGSAIGCRGRLRLLLLPLAALGGADQLFDAWSSGRGNLIIEIDADGGVYGQVGASAREWRLPRLAHGAEETVVPGRVMLAPPPAVLLLGCGPETALLLPQLHALGWYSTVIERRERWRDQLDLADHALAVSIEQGLRTLQTQAFDAALVMHHHFDLDRQALVALAAGGIRFIGLLGPPRRRDDLFKLLTEDQRAVLTPRLQAPVGLDLGGSGAEAIALSIAAQLHARLHAH